MLLSRCRIYSVDRSWHHAAPTGGQADSAGTRKGGGYAQKVTTGKTLRREWSSFVSGGLLLWGSPYCTAASTKCSAQPHLAVNVLDIHHVTQLTQSAKQQMLRRARRHAIGRMHAPRHRVQTRAKHRYTPCPSRRQASCPVGP